MRTLRQTLDGCGAIVYRRPWAVAACRPERLTSSPPIEMRQLLRVPFYLGSFALARGGLFVAPILIANLLPAADYGTLELAQALGSVGATVFALGTSSAVPLALVSKTPAVSWSSVLFHHAAMAVALALLACGLWLAGMPRAIPLACLCTLALLLQSLWSMVWKSRGHGEASLVLDTGLWAVLALSVVVPALLAVVPEQRGGWLLTGLVLYLLVLGALTLKPCLQGALRAAISNYASTLRASVPLMMATLLALFAFSSGRIGMGLVSTAEMTAAYAILFRATALPMVAHQIITVAKFRKLFEMPMENVERVLGFILSFVALGVATFWAFSGILGKILGPAFTSAFAEHRSAGLLILAQCLLWSAIALNDFVNTRLSTSAAVARGSILYFVAAFPAAWLYLSVREVDLETFVPVHSVLLAGYYVAQAAVMWRHGIRLFRTWSLTLSAFAILSALTQVL